MTVRVLAGDNKTFPVNPEAESYLCNATLLTNLIKHDNVVDIDDADDISVLGRCFCKEVWSVFPKSPARFLLNSKYVKLKEPNVTEVHEHVRLKLSSDTFCKVNKYTILLRFGYNV